MFDDTVGATSHTNSPASLAVRFVIDFKTRLCAPPISEIITLNVVMALPYISLQVVGMEVAKVAPGPIR